ncbi:MAG: phosphotransferase [Clostridium sp.]
MYLDSKIYDFITNSLKWNVGFITKISKLNGLNNFNYKMNYLGMDYFLSIKGPLFSKECIDTYSDVLSLSSNKNISYNIVHIDKENGNLLTHWIDGDIPDCNTINSQEFIINLCDSLYKFHSLNVSTLKNPFDSIVKRYNSCIQLNIKLPFDITDLIKKSTEISKKYSNNVHLGLCHNDLNPSNIIYNLNKCYLIDLEFSAMGDIFWDLATISYTMDSTNKTLLLKTYFGNSYTIFLEEKLKDFTYSVMLWNALWNLLKSIENNPSYDYPKAAHIILTELKKWN